MIDIVRFEKLADAPALSDDFVLITRRVADDGTALFLFVEAAGKDAVHGVQSHNGARFAKSSMDPPMRFRLVGVRADWHFVVDLPPLDITFPLVDLFPDGRVLVAGARCAWYSKTEFERNGAIYDPATGQAARILLGDGIAKLSVDRRGRIWVGYFDEGVFGNFGWSVPGPVGAAGLVCFSDTGDKLFEFAGDIVDCYALNVSGGDVFAFHYPEFSVSRVADGFRATTWTTSLRGCRELAIARDRVLLSGRYDDPPGIGYLGVLDGGALKGVERVRLVLPDGADLPTDALMGRGPHLYWFGDSSIYRATLEHK